MRRVEFYQKVRRAVLIAGESRRTTVAYFGISRKTVDKMLRLLEPPAHGHSGVSYSRKLAGFTSIIDAILEADRTVHPKQRHTGTRIPPAVLLANHIKALKLPTFVREYEKVAMEAAQDQADYPRHLLRLCELERIDRERRMVERRIRLAKFAHTKSFDTFDFAAQLSLNKPLVLELARGEWD